MTQREVAHTSPRSLARYPIALPQFQMRGHQHMTIRRTPRSRTTPTLSMTKWRKIFKRSSSMHTHLRLNPDWGASSNGTILLGSGGLDQKPLKTGVPEMADCNGFRALSWRD